MLPRREVRNALYRQGGMTVDDRIHGLQHAHITHLASFVDHKTRVYLHWPCQSHGRLAHVAEILPQGIAAAFHLGLLLYITIYGVAFHNILLRYHLWLNSSAFLVKSLLPCLLSA